MVTFSPKERRGGKFGEGAAETLMPFGRLSVNWGSFHIYASARRTILCKCAQLPLHPSCVLVAWYSSDPCWCSSILPRCNTTLHSSPVPSSGARMQFNLSTNDHCQGVAVWNHSACNKFHLYHQGSVTSNFFCKAKLISLYR